MKNEIVEVKFLGNAPCGYDGYGAVATLGKKRYENFKATGLYKMELVQNLVAHVSGKRARNKNGTLKADEKSTPNVNEAWEDGKAPNKNKKPGRPKKKK